MAYKNIVMYLIMCCNIMYVCAHLKLKKTNSTALCHSIIRENKDI